MDQVSKDFEELRLMQESLFHELSSLSKQIDDLMWYQKVGDIACVDKVTYIGPPPANPMAQPPQDRGNPLKIPAYTFVPVDADPAEKYPLLVFVHGGVHSNFSTGCANVIRELLMQGYVIIAPEYRGSTGYGQQFYRYIDYGGLENEDVWEGRNWMIENNPLVDPERVGIMGWSHGGMITLMNLFNHPEGYKVGYAGVPVSDLVARMGYKTEGYRQIFSASYHIGKTAYEDVNEYRRRSPAWNVEKLQTPLLIHTTTNDEDVNVLEVEHLIKSLKALGKDFEYKIYDNAPGGHQFNRIDTKLAKESRREIYSFLARYLHPPKPFE
ncbi:MAG TPA: prolyl oligopeptidase family serine peptidase [Bacillota bacterium]|nr:prolyl oligopeptidase family serine peptidase [Bacillota bacterium]HOL11718.1 prolyl oligopeptidase family serine peptidase [Bacillota bacterium]HOQ02368.1 prolyl oligopeptidase family serine peptidase [Bacillota bacterium]HPP60767.1 prolyl oligopeptidase family serine peptidase [Bacillota bacterium]HPV12806.1 prolyl oligopeptidase family serine peptidase [Bacillota bacterium]